MVRCCMAFFRVNLSDRKTPLSRSDDDADDDDDDDIHDDNGFDGDTDGHDGSEGDVDDACDGSSFGSADIRCFEQLDCCQGLFQHEAESNLWSGEIGDFAAFQPPEPQARRLEPNLAGLPEPVLGRSTLAPYLSC